MEVLLRRTVQGSVGNNALTILEVRCSSTQWCLMQRCVTVRGLNGIGMLKYLFWSAISTRKLAALGNLLVKGADSANVGYSLFLDFGVALLS